jgi:uncharacterized protein (UPF0332 family)
MEEDARNFLEKARESLASAETDLIAGRYNGCANRCYYACFQAAVAALIKAGVRPGRAWGHDFVGGRFAGDLVNRRHLYPSSFKNVLSDLFLHRQTGDYESTRISRTVAERSTRRTRDFVNAIQREF